MTLLNSLLSPLSASDIIDGEVPTFADLPTAVDHTGEIWAVLTSTGIWPFNKSAGLYISDGVNWNVFSAFNFPNISATSPITYNSSTGEISTSIATNRLVGRSTSGSGVMEQITIGSGLNLSGGTLTSTGSGGTVTNVSVATANGVSGLVTNPTTTPEITLTLGAITPSSVAASGTLSGSNFSGSSSGTNTGDQDLSSLTTGAASSTDNALVRFNGTTGKVIQNGGIIIDDSNNITGIERITATVGTALLGSNNSTPITNLNTNTGTGGVLLSIIAAAGGDPQVNTTGAGGSNPHSLGLDDSDSYKFKRQFNAAIGTNPYEIVTSSGQITKPLQPSFRAYNSTFRTNVTGSGEVYQVICNTALLNVGSSYNTTTGVFTAPITGIYIFTAGVGLAGLSTSLNTNYIFNLISTDATLEVSRAGITHTTMTISGSFIVEMGVGETIFPEIVVTGSSTGVDVRNEARITNFAGYLLG